MRKYIQFCRIHISRRIHKSVPRPTLEH